MGSNTRGSNQSGSNQSGLTERRCCFLFLPEHMLRPHMSALPSFNRKAVRPVECLEGGFAAIKDQYWLFVAISLVGMLIAGVVPLGILMGPIMCGIYLTLFRHMRGGKIEFSMLFKGFDHFVESLIATLLYFIPILLVMLPFYGVMVAAMFFFSRHNQAGGQPSAGAMALFGLGFFLFA